MINCSEKAASTGNAANAGRVDGDPILGSGLLYAGAVLLFLKIVDTAGGLPWEMPRFWYVNRSLWGFVAIAFLGAGMLLLRRRTPLADSWQPSQPGIRFDSIVLYTRAGCHLCDQAKDLLLKYRHYLPEIAEVDVDADEGLQARFGNCVPVVECDGRVRFRGQINEVLLRRLIEGTAPKGQNHGN